MLQDIKLVLFDLDNTLFSFEDYWTKATKDTFYQSSITKYLPFEEFFSYYRHYDHHFWDLHHQGHISLDEVRQQRLIYTLKHFDQEISVEEADTYFREFFSRLIYLVKPEEEVNAYLRELKKTYQVGIITNGKVNEQRSKIIKLQLHKVFTEKEIFISEEIGVEKPQQEAFHIPLLQYGIEPAQAIYVGDSWNNDVVGAINAGMSAIWINPKGNKPSSEHKPLFVTENIMALKETWMSLQAYGVKN
ncbi:HAD family hydrolase [Bacillus pseudomycoides]|uniref:HAD family hydrolase n=1 Tax=Bacillus pseudomycoides TaxID=64104 RepID=UPI000BF48738|nr:HAD family hydrolase [Bacillus pseudomycoides]PGD70610.1 hydrolase [Bacillus pseudomycoides]